MLQQEWEGTECTPVQAVWHEYDLTGCIMHAGETLEDGHFYAYVKSKDEWYHCNDEKVEKVAFSVVEQDKNKHYVHLYVRQAQWLPFEAYEQTPPSLPNYGNTCFANAAMQLLLVMPGVWDAERERTVLKKLQDRVVSQLTWLESEERRSPMFSSLSTFQKNTGTFLVFHREK